MKKISTLIIDPSQRVINALSDIIRRDNELEVTGAHTSLETDKIEALSETYQPDVVILGIDSTDSQEMEIFMRLRQSYPYLPVLILVPHNRTGAEAALMALKRGAVEYIVKTTVLSGSLLPDEHFKGRLIPILKAVPRLNRNILISGTFIDDTVKTVKQAPKDLFNDKDYHSKLLVIAGCLGGVPSLYMLLSSLPANLPVPVIVVQHMPEIFTSVLADDLNKISRLNVAEAKNNDELIPGNVYITPGNYHTTTNYINRKNVITLHKGPKVKGFRPSIDVLLKSTQNTFRDNVLAVYLSGGGKDGIDGAKVIDITGGQIILQNRSTSLLADLPWKIESLGFHDGTYPLNRLASVISDKIQESYKVNWPEVL